MAWRSRRRAPRAKRRRERGLLCVDRGALLEPSRGLRNDPRVASTRPTERIITVTVPGRGSGEPTTPEERLRFLEELIHDACVFAGIDAKVPLRRDVVRVLRRRGRR